jgi:3-oxoadipate enol-lactonase
MSFVRCNGVVHQYVETAAPAGQGNVPAHGSASGTPPALLCIHALGTSHRIWEDMLDALDWPGKVLRHDLRGHGLSEVGETPYDIAGLSRDASALLAQRGVESVVVCGLSVGGLIAQELAASDSRVRAAILCGTSSRIGTREGWRNRIAQVRAGGIASITDVALARWFGPEYRARAADDVRGYRCLLERTPETGYLAMLHALAEADLSERVRAIRVPTLVVSGSLDEGTPPADGRQLAERIAGARFELLEGASHLLAVEKPRELAALIATFAKELGLA